MRQLSIDWSNPTPPSDSRRRRPRDWRRLRRSGRPIGAKPGSDMMRGAKTPVRRTHPMLAKRSLLFALAAALPCLHDPAAAQSWPTRPVTMVVPFAAGGGTDVLGRIIGQRLSEVLGQQVIIENVGGAGGMVGSARVAKAPPDGYQFVLGSRADAINQTLYKNPLYNLATDLVPVVLVAEQPTVLITRKDYPARNLQDFIAYARKNQDTMQFASAGAGSTGHVDCALF